MRGLYIGLGVFFVGLGVIGIVVPILPTTPFLLLALWLFTRSSPRMKNWLLTNRFCGGYISDYHNGKGIPVRVKIYTLALLWATITYGVVEATQLLWVRILLFAVAIGVSAHILRFKTKSMKPKIVIIVPTQGEAVGFSGWLPKDIVVIVGGVGMAETAASTALAITKHKPSVTILAGIAGAYPDSGVMVGDCVVVESEQITDLGAIRENGFAPLYQKKYQCEYIDRFDSLRKVAGCTINTAASDRGGFGDVVVENMEGAAFFAVCGAMGVDFMEVRAISNLTTDPRSEWQIERATEALNKELQQIIKLIRA